MSGVPAHGFDRLPSGRHGLPRDFVVSNQRERILDGVMSAVSTNGYNATRIEDVIRFAGVSRRTFYDHFANKEEAFLAAYDLVVDQLRAGVTGAYTSGATWPSRIRRGLAAFLNLIAAEPALAHVCIVEVVAAGHRALERRMRAMEDFKLFLPPPSAHGGVMVSPVTAETVVGGVYEVIYARVVSGRTAELPALMPSLLYSIVLPFAGSAVATAEYRRATGTLAARRAALAASGRAGDEASVKLNTEPSA